MPQPFAGTLALLMVLVVAAADISSGAQVAFSIFYLAPVLLASWFASRMALILVATAAGATFPVTETILGIVYRADWIPYWNFGVRAATYLVVGLLGRQLRTVLQRERQLARTDPLTGALNGRSFQEAAAVEIARAHRSGKVLSVAYLDLDGFKTVNDQFGHDAGDELIRGVATLLRDETRPSDLVARLGGDEFAVLFPETEVAGAGVVLERVRGAIRGLAEQSGYDVSASIGAATFDRLPETVDELLWPADQLMYAAKRAGKNQIRQRSVVAGSDDAEWSSRRTSAGG